MKNLIQYTISFIVVLPLPTTHLTALHVCLTHFTVLWDSVTSDPLCGPVEYDVTISSSDGVKFMRVVNTSYNFTGLTPSTYYIITVAAVNQVGVGQSTEIAINTPTMTEALPSGK